MKIYKSLDFEKISKRIEPNEPGEYLVHLEDFESLNDLISRSIRTRTPFEPERDSNAYYDTDEDIADLLNQEKQELFPEQAIEEEKPTDDVERSEDQSEAISSESDASGNS